MRRGIFFHPSDEDLLPGDPVEKNVIWLRGFCKQNRNRCSLQISSHSLPQNPLCALFLSAAC